MKQDVVAVVEAAYSLDADDTSWFRRVVDAATPLLTRGLGVLAWEYDVSDPARMRIWSQTYAGGSDEQGQRMFAGLAGSTAEMSPEQNRLAYVEAGPVKTLSEIYGGVPRQQPGFGKHVASMGAQDFLVVFSQDPSLSGCALAVPLPSIARTPARDARTWTRIAAHVAAGRRLRAETARAAAAAVLTPGGRVEHAEGDARSPSARQALRDAALRVDRARSKARGDPDEGLSLWQGLVAGRWSLVDRFDSDGRRYIIARENDPSVPDPRALSPRERQVLAYAALGHPLKLTAYELGLSVSNIARHRANAMRKLGLRSHADLARLFATRGGLVDPLPPDGGRLTFSSMSNPTQAAVASPPAAREASVERTAARSVEGVHRSTTFHWVGNGFHVSTYFPSQNLPSERVSPFVLMDYGPPKEFAPLARGKRGVGWHPHRGFETVTLAWEGAVAHRDNAGHAGVIGPGDVQWMTAGAGIFHEEFHDEETTRRGGRMHMMQLWVNLARKDKAAPPAYQPIVAADIPAVKLEGGGTVRVVAGEYRGARGPARTFSPITMLDARIKAGERLEVPLPATYNALAVVADGRVRAGDRAASTGELVLFANDGAAVEITATEDAHVIVLAGEPLREPVVQYGPFVMSTRQEIQQAIMDVEGGRFGPVPED